MSPLRSELERESSTLKETASQKSSHLNASRRHLTEISSRILSSVSQLMFLDLSFNYITHVGSDSFSNNAEIQEVNLQGNEITDLAADVFSKTQLLSHLDLSHNKIRTLKTNVFINNQKLLFLNVSHNRLEFIYTKTFESSVNLEELYLDGNDLRFIDVDTFASCKELRVISLSNNSLQQLPGGVFKKLSKLEMVFLSKNSLNFMPRDVFANNPKLRVVDLSENRLTYLGSSTFLWNRLLVSLRLENNPWVCDSGFRKMIYSLQRKVHHSRVRALGTVPYKDKEICLDSLCPRVLENNLVKPFQTLTINNSRSQFSLGRLIEKESVKPNSTTEIPKEEEDFLDDEKAERDLALIFILSGVAVMTLTIYLSLAWYRRRRISKSEQRVQEDTKQDTTLA